MIADVSESKSPANHLVLLILFLIVVGLVIQGIMLSQLYVDQNPDSRILKISERIETLENTVAKEGMKGGWRKFFKEDSDEHPFQEVQRIQEDVDEMFDQSLKKLKELPGFDDSWLEKPFDPAADFEEMKDYYLVRLDLPGIEKSKFEISINGQILSVEGAREERAEFEEEGKIIRTERRYGKFHQSFMLPGSLNLSKVRAVYKHGVLMIRLQKGSDVPKDHQVEVEWG